ncbi:S-layer homology domain-containing protein [Paenibacillus sp. SC116]|uniref:S-layer homology domain-containing protein n=1 Tax=Paenibacillus sp. SC116 TaxID=2968986 RepID=UPI00215AD3F7|nr:S-layer homology domain-containing protein [Paenibacillus sp. SC116]MCR8845179.1 S-layer homology domain-containing protein [Paenibacillus sp. SC116]
MKKRIATLLSVTLAFSTLLSALAAPASVQAAVANEGVQVKNTAAFKDVESHWAKEKIAEWASQGVISGASANEFKPNQQVTRAEWAAIVNRMFQLNEQKPQAYTDVPAGAWYADAVNTATTAGYMKGYTDFTFKPNATLTRQEAVASLSRLLKWKTNSTALTYKDSVDIQPWAASSVSEAVYLGVVKGYEEGTFKPNQSLTRAEAVSMLDRAFDTYGVWYGQAGTYGAKTKQEQETINGNVIVNVSGVTLQNVHIKGDLILTQGVGEGDAALNNVKVDGKTLVYGGGKNSIHVNDSVLSHVTVNKKDGIVRFMVKGASTVQELILQSPAIVDVQDNAKIVKLQLSETLKAQSEVQLNGVFPSVMVSTYGSNLKLAQGAIQQLTVSKGAVGTKIEAAKDVTIESLIIHAGTNVTGQAVIKQVTLNAAGVSFAAAPKEWKLGENVNADTLVTVAGKETKAGDLIKSTTTTGGGGGFGGGFPSGGGGSNGGVTPEKPGGNGGQENNSVVKLTKEVFSVGEVVYGTSSKQGTVYVVQESWADKGIEEWEWLINTSSSTAKKTEVQPDGSFFVTHDSIITDEYVAIVVDENKKYHHSDKFYIWWTHNRFEFHSSYQFPPGYGLTVEHYALLFSHPIKVKEHVDIRKSVMVATYEDPTYRPIGDDVKIEINKSNIRIIPSTKLTNNWISFKLLPDAVTSRINGASNHLAVSDKHPSMIRVDFPGMKWDSFYVFERKGTKISVVADKPVVLHFTPGYGKLNDIDELVRQGLGRKIVFDDQNVGQIQFIDTSDLPVNQYWLYSPTDNIYYLLDNDNSHTNMTVNILA